MSAAELASCAYRFRRLHLVLPLTARPRSSMFAAKAGAKKVIGVDMSNIIDQAQKIVAANGFADSGSRQSSFPDDSS